MRSSSYSTELLRFGEVIPFIGKYNRLKNIVSKPYTFESGTWGMIILDACFYIKCTGEDLPRTEKTGAGGKNEYACISKFVRATSGKDHPHVAVIINSLVEIYHAEGKVSRSRGTNCQIYLRSMSKRLVRSILIRHIVLVTGRKFLFAGEL